MSEVPLYMYLEGLQVARSSWSSFKGKKRERERERERKRKKESMCKVIRAEQVNYRKYKGPLPNRSDTGCPDLYTETFVAYERL